MLNSPARVDPAGLSGRRLARRGFEWVWSERAGDGRFSVARLRRPGGALAAD